MKPLRVRRLRLVAVLLALLFGLCVWYGTYGVAPDVGLCVADDVLRPERANRRRLRD